MAPYDFLVADQALSEGEVLAARTKARMWLADGIYPMLPYSSLLLESVPDMEAPTADRPVLKTSAAAPANRAASQWVVCLYYCWQLSLPLCLAGHCCHHSCCLCLKSVVGLKNIAMFICWDDAFAGRAVRRGASRALHGRTKSQHDLFRGAVRLIALCCWRLAATCHVAWQHM